MADAKTEFVWNPRALTAIEQGMAEGLYELGMTIAADAVSTMSPEYLDAPPYGEGLIASAGVGVWNQGVLMKGPALLNAPGSMDPKPGPNEITMVVGFGSPVAHLQELGTVKMVAHPFLAPAVNRNVKGTEELVVPAIGKRVAEVPE